VEYNAFGVKKHGVAAYLLDHFRALPHSWHVRRAPWQLGGNLPRRWLIATLA
jgi:hypothetical protein